MVGRKITIIASPLLKEWKLKKLIGRDGVIIKKNQNQKKNNKHDQQTNH